MPKVTDNIVSAHATGLPVHCPVEPLTNELLGVLQWTADTQAAVDSDKHTGRPDDRRAACMAFENYSIGLESDVLRRMGGLVPQSALGAYGVLAAVDGATFDTAADDASEAEAARERIRGFLVAFGQWIEISTGVAPPPLKPLRLSGTPVGKTQVVG